MINRKKNNNKTHWIAKFIGNTYRLHLMMCYIRLIRSFLLQTTLTLVTEGLGKHDLVLGKDEYEKTFFYVFE